MTANASDFRWSSIILPAYLPTLLYSIGEGGLIPLIPRIAGDLGASLAMAGLISGMIMIGTLVADLPSGWLVSRIGERAAMLWGAALTVIGMLLVIAATAPWMLAAGVFCVGLATAVFALARQAFLTTVVPQRYRARALSTLGGVFRGGNFIGPLTAAALIPIAGDQAVIWFSIAVVLLVVLVLWTMPDPAASFGRADSLRQDAEAELTTGEITALEESQGLFRTIWTHRKTYLTISIGTGMIMVLRTGRAVGLPLWAISIGMDSASTSFWIGVGAFIDFALFYTSGQVMDRFGRLWGAIPPMLLMGVAYFVLAGTHDLPNAQLWFIALTLLLGTANGFSSGVVLTLAADLAPKTDPAPFLGGWRFVTDSCSALTPLILALMTAVASISAGMVALGALGIGGAWMLWRWVPPALTGSSEQSATTGSRR